MYDDELTAFRESEKANKINCILFVDTCNTLKNGVSNAIKVTKKMEKRDQRLLAVRLDSGDLPYLARRTRKQLDDVELDYVKIAASNQLNEICCEKFTASKSTDRYFQNRNHSCHRKAQWSFERGLQAGESRWESAHQGFEKHQKTTLPGKKQVYRMYDSEGTLFEADAISDIDKGDEITSTVTADGEDINVSIYVDNTKISDTIYTFDKTNIYEVSVCKEDHTDSPKKEVKVYRRDVYVAGYKSNDSKNIAKYWKNGTAVDLTDGNQPAVAYSVFVDKGDVYVAEVE